MTLSPELLAVLACPEDKGPLLYFEGEDLLYNPRLHRRYDVRDDIPVMLVEEATTVDDDEAGTNECAPIANGAGATGDRCDAHSDCGGGSVRGRGSDR